ncbi:transcriptional regulator [Methanococcoides methylutens]|uniref:transcriptional regulator n=1 Tax=Methanococcoides methylutens TaxID=2226 RepID=UPI004043A7BE
MDELMGFITGNKNRQKLLALLGSKGEMDAARIAKNMHVVKISVDKILAELVERELITENGGLYGLTALGTDVERSIHAI